ncbi:MAG: alpha/beta fold hydrolase [Planctomycetota bacterium]|jgi:haloalkane dehalogenase|nr:alpha/beta fold hydrolase [Planctomycetota bacterium]MDP6764121.1 alpha/beta fold hydrolase [Planctomycetota bacterium]MDP6989590.1 alpha/beta fold hydrolase [Planctomycetota bacterium]
MTAGEPRRTGGASAAILEAPAPSPARAAVAPLPEEVRAEFPFEPRWLETPAGRLHFVDEGPREADPLVCVHGNPTWSFAFRHVVAELADRHRVIALDHLGCGRSDKPGAWSYRLAGHVENLERLLVELDLERVTLLVHDWGGAIGLGAAVRQSERIAGLAILNSAAFPFDRIPLRIDLCRTPFVGQALVRGLGAFSRAACRMALAKRERMTPAVRRGYLAPYDSWEHRIAIWKFVADIPMTPRHPSYADLAAIDAALPVLRDRPALIAWGERDWCFTPAFRHAWAERLPRAEVHPIEDAGHLVLEDAHEQVLPWLRAFLERPTRR